MVRGIELIGIESGTLTWGGYSADEGIGVGSPPDARKDASRCQEATPPTPLAVDGPNDLREVISTVMGLGSEGSTCSTCSGTGVACESATPVAVDGCTPCP